MYEPYDHQTERQYTKEERNWAVILHLSCLIGFIIPWAGFIVPFGIWLIKRNESDYLDRQGKEVMNFLISIIILSLIGLVLSIVLVGIAIIMIVALAAIVLTIISAVRVSDGVDYRYPYILRLIR